MDPGTECIDDLPVGYSVPVWARFIVILALLSGLGSGTLSIVGTADRYHGAEAEKDFALRDAEIKHLQEQYRELRQQVQRIDESHPPQELLEDIKDHERRLRTLERNKP